MQIIVENIECLSTNVETASLSNAIELRNLIGGDITIAVGNDTMTYEQVSIVDFSMGLASSIVRYLSSGGNRLEFWSPDCHDAYSIRVTEGYGLSCEVFRNSQMLSDQESLLEIIHSMRPFIGQTKTLLEERYGHIEYIWDVLVVPVF